MPTIRILAILILISVGSASAVTVSLRGNESQSSTFETEIGEQFKVDIFVEPEGESIAGFAIFLSFDNRFLEIVDSDSEKARIQPVKISQEVPENWRVFDNDTHADPGNEIDLFQIDYVQTSVGGGDLITDPTVIGQVTFKSNLATSSTSVVFDADASVSRITEATVVNAEKNQQQVVFSNTSSAVISIGGGPILTKTFPPIRVLLGKSDKSLNLNDYVTDSNDSNNVLTWSAEGEHIAIEIDQSTHLATLSVSDEFVGMTKVLFTVRDPKGNSASDIVPVTVVSAPKILPFPKINSRVGKTKSISLSNYVVDLDSPNLKGLSWKISQGSKLLDLQVSRGILTMRGKAVQIDPAIAIALKATDGDQHSTIAPLFVSIFSDQEALVIKKIPEVIVTNIGKMITPAMGIILDDYVFDIEFPSNHMSWTFDRNQNLILDIDLENRRFHIVKSKNGWIGAEKVTLRATNPNGKSVSTSIDVRVIEAGAPPILSEIPAMKLLVNDGSKVAANLKTLQLDLKKYVSDYNHNPEQMKWESSDHQLVKVNINPQGIATISADQATTEMIRVYTIDPDGNRDSTRFIVTVIKPTPPTIKAFPVLRLRLGEAIQPFNLDDFVTDIFTPDERIIWKAEGFDPKNLLVEINKQRQVKFSGKSMWHGTETVKLTATNEATLFQTVLISVVGTAKPKIAFKTNELEVGEGWRVIIDLDAIVNDPDTEKDKLNWKTEPVKVLSALVNPVSRTLVIEAPKESAGSYSLGLSVTDPDNNKGTVTLLVKVIDYPKSKPVITELSQISFRSDQVYSLPLNKVITDKDTQLDKIVWEISGNKKVKVSINPGKQISFSALSKDFEGTELITLTATDPEKQSDKKSVLVAVVLPPQTPIIKEFPEINIHQKEIDDSLKLPDYVLDRDTPLEKLKFTIVNQVHTSVKLDLESKTLVIASADKELGKEEVTLVVEDPEKNRASQSIIINVSESPPIEPPKLLDFPVLSIKLSELPDAKPFTIKLDDFVQDKDTDKKSLKWSIDKGSDNIKGEIELKTRVAIIEILKKDFTGDARLSIKVSDPEGKEAKGEIQVTVIDDSPKPPEIVDLPSQITFKCGIPEVSLDLSKYVKDPDSPMDSLKLTLSSESKQILIEDIDLSSPIVRIAPASDFTGAEVLTFIVKDPGGLTATAQLPVFIEATSVDSNPPVLPASMSIEITPDELQTVNLNEIVFDADTPKLQIKWTWEDNEKFDFEINEKTKTGQLRLKSMYRDFRGTESIPLLAEDQECGSASTVLKVTVLDPPDTIPPSFTIYLLPNPIQPDFLTVNIQASEELKTRPKLKINDENIPVQPNKDVPQTWNCIYVVSKGFAGLIEFTVTGEDTAGLSTTELKSFDRNTLPSAPKELRIRSTKLLPNYPNPFNPETWIPYQLADSANVALKIYTDSGFLVREFNLGNQHAGHYTDRNKAIYWDGRNSSGETVAAGLYFYQLTADDFTEIRPALIVK